MPPSTRADPPAHAPSRRNHSGPVNDMLDVVTFLVAIALVPVLLALFEPDIKHLLKSILP